ncbi:hypothetical protein QO014_003456 [Kaistia dalseonensis]|uniref:Uncharacterized protein n=1 Tax=Kaistia dalseonensis TaxID=410840 RepID=A0ABU0H9Q7_9HYPH|nr:hypothetical protein [Kaistia dalseonensis]
MLKYFLAAAISVAGIAAAHGQSIPLGREGAKGVIVWKDNDSYSEAMTLIRAGVHRTNPQMLNRLVSCYVPKGTAAVVVDGGWLSSTVLIIAGASEGCRGIVPNEELPKQP